MDANKRKGATDVQKLMKELNALREPPFWFEHALAFCKFDRLQLYDLVKGITLKQPRPEIATIPAGIAGDNKPCGQHQTSLEASRIKRAVECGLSEPILASVAEYRDDLKLVIEILETASASMDQKFPWLFLAYLGTRKDNTPLVEKCVCYITDDEGDEGKESSQWLPLPTLDEIGMSYIVWRFLVRANRKGECGDTIRDAFFKRLQLAATPARHDWTLLHLAATYGDQDCLEILLCQPGNRNHTVLCAATTQEGFTPLHLAAWFGHTAIVLLLLEHADTYPDPTSADKNFIPRDRLYGRSPLHHACMNGYPEIVSILVDKWGSVGVDLQDRFGITSLHVAASTLFFFLSLDCNKEIFRCLIRATRNPNQKVAKDFTLQRAMISRFLLDRRSDIDSLTTSSLFVPTPIILQGIMWTFQEGFTFLHCIPLTRRADYFEILLKENVEKLNWAAEDCRGLNPIDYADYYSEFKDFLQCTAPNVADLYQPHRVFINRPTVHGMVLEIQSNNIKDLTLRWVYEVDVNLISGSYLKAHDIMHRGEAYGTITMGVSKEEYKLQVDDEVWDHLEWALEKALNSGRRDMDHDKIVHAPRLQASDVEEMVLVLVQRKQLHGKSVLQRCLQWAISRRMAMLAEELVKDMECEVVVVVPGGDHEESPLARASESAVAKDMPGLVVAMELREDVKRSWNEDRQVYVDYANTLLVGAVLIAGLAFAAWLQPPQADVNEMGIIEMKHPAMRVFVWSSTLAFSLGMGTMVAGATGAMPFALGTGKLVSARQKMHNAVVIASLFLVGSIVCLTICFSAAALAILPFSHNPLASCLLSLGGIFLCWMLSSFLKCLRDLNGSTLASFDMLRNLFTKKDF